MCVHRVVELTEEHRSKVLCLLLHSADVSNPAKPWEVHTRWTGRIMEEFFEQGDREKQLSLPPSPLCDRNTTNIPESQLGGCTHTFSKTHIYTQTKDTLTHTKGTHSV